MKITGFHVEVVLGTEKSMVISGPLQCKPKDTSVSKRVAEGRV
jgi:hypothetical protein